MSRLYFAIVIVVVMLLLGNSAFAAKPVVMGAVDNDNQVPFIEVSGTLLQKENQSVNATVDATLIYIAELAQTVTKGQRIAEFEDLALDLLITEKQTAIEQLTLTIKHLKKRYQAMSQLNQHNHESEMALDEMFTEIDIGSAKINGIKARLTILQRQKAKLVLYAPVDGVIIARMALPGEHIEAFSPLMTIQNQTDNQLRIRLAAKQAKHLVLHAPVVVTLDKQNYKGTIASIHTVKQGFSLLYEARISVPSASRLLGSLMQVRLPLTFDTPYQLIPNDAVIYTNDQATVVIIDQAQTAKHIAINIHQRFKQFVVVSQITGRPSKFVVAGNESLRDGDEVKVINFQSYKIL